MIRWNFIQEENHNSISELKVDASFRKLSRNAICFHIWKVEEDRVEAVCKSNYGTFHDDCAYIIYASCPNGTHVNQDTITRDVKQPTTLERYIHFWLGEKVTSQKSGNVAYKVMELDSYFGNTATQFRESQDNESARFMSYFKKGITIMSGPLATSCRPCRLFQLRGRKWLHCSEMENINWDHFSSDFVMILKTTANIFLWLGRSSPMSDRRLALDIARKFQEMFALPDLVIVDDGYEQSMSDARKQDWNKYLPLKDRFVNQLLTNEKPMSSNFKLYKCGYQNGKYRIEELKSSLPDQLDLNDSESAYIIDGFSLGVWVWVGKLTEPVEKTEAMRNARGFVKKKKYPSSTSLIRVIEGHEPLEFIRLFPNWKEHDSAGTKPGKLPGKLDSLTISQRPKLAAESQLIDDGTGERRIFRFTSGNYTEIAESSVIFSTDSSYLLHYTVTLSGNNTVNDLIGVKNVVYVWFGKLSQPETKAKCENFALEYFEKLGRKSMIVKLNEGHETPHFLQIFAGKFIVMMSDKSVNENNNSSNASSPQRSNFILKVHGDSTFNARAVEIHLADMTSKDCFVVSGKSLWVWCGQKSTGDSREVAKKIGSVFGESTLLMESKEPNEFWNSISNKLRHTNGNGYSNGLTSSSSTVSGVVDKSKLQFYLLFSHRGNVRTQEILAFEQADLEPENIYLMDAQHQLFIWIGKLTQLADQQQSWKLVKQFLQNSPIPRNENTAVALIRQGEEPNIFTGFFDSWNEKFWQNHQSFDKLRQFVAESADFSLMHIINKESDFDNHQKFPLSILRSPDLPSEVDPLRKEVHLTNDDFVAVFSMNFSEFNSLPGWKQQELKKKYKLF